VTDTSTSAPEPITVIILSWNRPLYLWACLDSLYRYTEHPARFILVDNHSVDPGVRKVVAGFERRGMFAAVEWHTENSPDRVTDAIDRHQQSSSDYLVYIESDVAVFDTEPCWLTRMRMLMDADSNLGLLGSYIDTRDFIDPALARRIEPDLDPFVFDGLIKAASPERRLSQIPPATPVIDPFNPPGRLAMVRKEIIHVIRTGTDGAIYQKLKAAGIGAGIATQVQHRHLSLLNFFDYPGYDIAARSEMAAKVDR
jgi:hypothetical protein